LSSHRDIDFNCHNKSIITPLAIAAENGHENIVSFLAQTRHIDLYCADISGMTPLLKAAENGHGEATRLLLSYAYPTPKEISGGHEDLWAAFSVAVKGGHLSVVEIFLDSPGFVGSVSDFSRLWALRESKKLAYSEMYKVLLSYMPPSTWEKLISH
jgi:ankyrin repeat protein